MSYAFVEGGDGIIEIQMPGTTSVLVEALNDSVSSRAPQGAVHGGLSTYWIDVTVATLRMVQEWGPSGQIAFGDYTDLQLDGEDVLASYEWDPPGVGERIPLDDFLALLAEWRAKVIAAGGASGSDAAAQSWEGPDPFRPGLGRSGQSDSASGGLDP